MNTKSNKLSIIEKLGYSFGDLAANLIFQTLITFLAYFYTDIYGLKGPHASILIFTVGIFAAIVFNPIIGALSDRTNSRWGKFRPWILFTAIPFGAVALLTFTTPNFPYKWKLVYAGCMYALLLLVYSANNLPYSSLSGVITGDMKERNSLSSYRFVAVNIAQFFVQVLMLPLVLHVGHGDKALGMEKVMTALAIIGTILLLITFFTTRERIIPKAEQKSSLKQDLKDLSKNKPWIIMLIVTTLVFITLSMKGGSYVYYFNNYVDNAALDKFLRPILGFLSSIGINIFDTDSSIAAAGFGLFNAFGIIFSIIGISISPKLADKYGKRDVFMSTLFIATLFIILFVFFKPTDIWMMYLTQIGHMFFYGITTPILWAMIADVADYSEWKTNHRATGIIFSAMLVGLNIGVSVGQSLVALIMSKFGYISTAAVQVGSVATGSKLLISIFPAIPFLIGIGLLFFYEINKKMEVQIQNELSERR